MYSDVVKQSWVSMPSRSQQSLSDARRKASGSKVMGYDGHCRELSEEQVAAFRADDRAPVVRFRMPEGSISWDDLVREISTALVFRD